MDRTKLWLMLVFVACAPSADPAAASQRATSTPAPELERRPAASVAALVAPATAKVDPAGPACRAFLSCCDQTRARSRMPIDCNVVVAEGEATCASALRNYRAAPEPFRSRMPAACTEMVP